MNAFGCYADDSIGDTAQEVTLIHAVLKGLAAVDEDHRNFVVEAAAQVIVGIDIYFAPLKAGAAG